MTDPTTDRRPVGTPGVRLVSVRGAAVVEAEPELLRIGVTATPRAAGHRPRRRLPGRAADRRAAFDDLSRRDASVLDPARGHGAAVAKPGAGGAGEEEPEPVLDLEPERQTARAQVAAHFTRTPPDLR